MLLLFLNVSVYSIHAFKDFNSSIVVIVHNMHRYEFFGSQPKYRIIGRMDHMDDREFWTDAVLLPYNRLVGVGSSKKCTVNISIVLRFGSLHVCVRQYNYYLDFVAVAVVVVVISSPFLSSFILQMNKQNSSLLIDFCLLDEHFMVNDDSSIYRPYFMCWTLTTFHIII